MRRDNSYGVFQTGNTWVTNKGSITNTILRYPLWQRCECPCEAKIVTSSTTNILFISNPHTAEHHSKDKDKSVYLSYEPAMRRKPLSTLHRKNAFLHRIEISC